MERQHVACQHSKANPNRPAQLCAFPWASAAKVERHTPTPTTPTHNGAKISADPSEARLVNPAPVRSEVNNEVTLRKAMEAMSPVLNASQNSIGNRQVGSFNAWWRLAGAGCAFRAMRQRPAFCCGREPTSRCRCAIWYIPHRGTHICVMFLSSKR